MFLKILLISYKAQTVHSPLFFREIVQIYRVLPLQLSCYSNVSRGRVSGIIALGQAWGEEGGGGAE